ARHSDVLQPSRYAADSRGYGTRTVRTALARPRAARASEGGPRVCETPAATSGAGKLLRVSRACQGPPQRVARAARFTGISRQGAANSGDLPRHFGASRSGRATDANR